MLNIKLAKWYLASQTLQDTHILHDYMQQDLVTGKYDFLNIISKIYM